MESVLDHSLFISLGFLGWKNRVQGTASSKKYLEDLTYIYIYIYLYIVRGEKALHFWIYFRESFTTES